MNILLLQQCYNWLVSLKILKPYIVPSHNISPSHQQFIQVCYDDQIYLENGYLIGVLLKDILKGHQLYSQKLIKIRKITVLKKYQNWEIVYDVLSFLDYDEVQPPQNVTSERQLIIYEIQNILHFLFYQYGPHSHLRNQQTKRTFHIEPQKLQKLYDKNQRNNQLDGVDMYWYKDCKNVLEYMVMVIKNSFVGLSVGECLGLLVDKGRVLNQIIVKGVKDYSHKSNDTKANNISSNYNAYHCIQLLYQQVLKSIQYFQQLIIHQPHHLSQFMSILAIGAQSRSPQVGKLTRQFLQTVQCSEWFFSQGISTLIKSQHIEILSLIIQKSIGKFSSIFDIQKLSQHFTYNQDILLFLSRLLPIVAKSRFSKQIIQSLSVQNVIQRALTAFMLQQFEEYEQSQLMSRQLSRQLIVLIYRCFYKVLSEEQKQMGIIAFQTQLYKQQQQQSSLIMAKTKLSFIQSIQLLTQLFEIIKIFLINQDVVVEKWFKIALKFMRVNNSQLKQFVINNLKELYVSLGRSFPLGAFLETYNMIIFNYQSQQIDINKTKRIQKQCQLPQTISLINTTISTAIIPQCIDFNFLQRVSLDLSLVEDQILNTLNITLQMFLQINGNCFIHILSNLVKFKQSSPWAQTIVTQLLTKWTQLKLPLLNTSNLYNRKTPIQKCKFEAFGIKRREILKFEQYQKYKMLLQILCNLKDKEFLRLFYRNVNKKLQEINRQVQLKPYGVFLKKLLEKIKLSKQLVPQIAMDMMEKSLMRLSQNYDRDTVLMNDSRQLDIVSESHVFIQQQDKDERQDKDEKDNEMKEQMNEFLSQQQMKSKKQKNEDQRKRIQRPYDQVYNPIQSFTSPDQSFPYQQIQLLAEQQMQHHEILYLKILRQTHPQLLDYCCTTLVQNMNLIQNGGNESKQDAIKNGLMGFLRQLKIEKYIGIDQAKRIFDLISKQQEYSLANRQQFTWRFLIQMAFCIFGFRRTTRVRVKLVQTFFSILLNSLKQQLTRSPITITQANNSQIPVNDTYSMMRRQMVYENQFAINRVINWNKHLENVYLRSERVENVINNNKRTREEIVGQVLDSYNQQNLQNTIKSKYKKIIEEKGKQTPIEKKKQKYEMKKVVKNQLQPYLISFQIINDILLLMNSSNTNKYIGFGLIEPISRVITKVKQQNQEQNNTQKHQQQIDKTEQEKQLAYLQIELKNHQKAKNDQLLLEQNKKRKDSSKSPILSLTKSKVSSSLSSSYTKKLPNQNLNFTSQLPPQFSKLSTLQLKEKINSRKTQIEEQLKKKPKKLQNQNFSKLKDNSGNSIKTTTPLGLDTNDIVDQQTRRQLEQLISYNIDGN